LDVESARLTDVALLPEERVIPFVLDTGDAVYMIAQAENGSQSVYFLNLDDFAPREIYDGKSGEKVVYLSANAAAVIRENQVFLKRVDGGTVSDVMEISLDENVAQEEYKTDMAGDWLFIYQFDKYANADALRYRINVVTGECVKTAE
jgi:hypothetical protein